jgi:MGT family glycosyltransferase
MSDECNRLECEATGARFTAWKRAPSRLGRSREFDNYNDWGPANPLDGLLDILQKVWIGPAAEFAEDLAEELRREPADLVVASDMLFGVLAGCEMLGQPHVIFSANTPIFPTPGFIPLGPGLAPPTNDEERAMHAGIAAGTLEYLSPALTALNEGRARLGLPPVARLTDQYRGALAHLIGTSSAFDFAPDVMPEGYAYVGPQLGEPAWAQPWTSPFAQDDQRPLALVSFSTTFQNHTGPLQRVIDAIGSLPMRAVVTLGGSIRPDELNAPENVFVCESAPHHAIMPETAFVVTHGGHGTVAKALMHGKPMLVIPHGRDQNDNAMRVTHRGAGLSVQANADVAEFRGALARLLNEASFAAAARTLGAHVARDTAQSPIVDMLEGYVGERVACAA